MSYYGRDRYAGGYLHTGDAAKQARKERALSERIYCVGCDIAEDGRTVALRIEGTQGVVYDVRGSVAAAAVVAAEAGQAPAAPIVIDGADEVGDASLDDKLHMTCTCADFERRHAYCKHIFNVMYRVFGVERGRDNLRVRHVKAHMSRLAERQAGIAAAVAAVVGAPDSRDADAAAAGDDDDVGDDGRPQQGPAKRRKIDVAVAVVPAPKQRDFIDADGVGEDCAVCYEEMTKAEQGAGKIDWCHTQCGKSFHAECLRRWINRNPVCPLCKTCMKQKKSRRTLSG
jgi:hypothetical protein